MYSMFEECYRLTSLDVSNFKTDNVTDMSYMFDGCSNLTSLDVSGFKTDNVTRISGMFSGCSKLTSLDVSGFNTDNVTDMSAMFYGCRTLKSLDVTNFKTDNVTSMGRMFSYCSALTSLDVTNFKTDNVTDMSQMFEACSSLTSLDVTNFKTDNVTDMGAMFSECSCLTSLDLSNFNTGNVTNMGERNSWGRGMFWGCYELNIIYVGSGWSTEAVTESGNMFAGCTNLIGGAGTIYDANHTDHTYAHIDGGASNPGYFTRSGESPYVIRRQYAVLTDNNDVITSDENGTVYGKTLTFYYDEEKVERNGMSIGPFSNSSKRWCGYAEDITTVVFDDSFVNFTTLTSTAYWFSDCCNLTSITGIENLNTENVTGMSSMFSGCSGLTTLDARNFKTDNVTQMGGMFSGCSGLTSLNVRNFKTDNVKNMSNMFYGCSGLTTLDVSNFKTDNVTYMSSIFSGCSKLTSLDVSGFNTANVTDMRNMFSGCSKLTSLDVSNFNTDKVTSMSCMYSGCYSLTSLDVSGFKTDNVTNMSYMFESCSGLTSLDVSNFKTDKVTDMSNMFNICSELNTIYAGSGWSTEAVTSGVDMFKGCTKLVGGAGTPYDSTHVDVSYAHIDGGTSNPGYFTSKNATIWSVIGTINGDWGTDTEMTTTDGVNFEASIPSLLAGNYEFKIRANGSWEVNYGANGVLDGDNIVATVNEDLSTVVITFNAETKEIAYSVLAPVFSVIGSTADEYGTPTSGWLNWADDADMTKDENGIYSVTFDNMEVGNYQYKIRANHDWTYNWGVDGMQDGANHSLIITEAGPVTIYFDPVTHIASTSYPQQMEQVAPPTFSWNEDMLTMSSETEGATISYKLEDGYYLVGGNGEWGNNKSQKLSQSSDEHIYTYVLQSQGDDLWFAFGDVAALNAIDNGDWNQLFGATVDGGELSGTYDRRYNLDGDHSFHVDGLAAYYRFTINTQDKTYLIEPLDSDPGFIASEDNVYTYTNPIEIKHDVYITAIARKEGMIDSEVAILDYPYTAWQDLRDAISIARDVYGQAKDNDLVPEQMQNELYYQILSAEDSCVVRTAKADVINEMAYSLRSLADNILQMLNIESEPYAVLDGDTISGMVLTFYYDKKKSERNGMSVGPFETSDERGWDAESTAITEVVFDISMKEYNGVTSTLGWFSRFSNLATITGLENLNTANVTNMKSMFDQCSSLTSIDLSGFNTTNVTDMMGMFVQCTSLTSIDLSSFNTANVEDMRYMFQACSALQTIYVGDGWSTSSVTNKGTNIFIGCTSLVGGMGTVYDENHVDYTYAHIDEGTTNPGYFTPNHGYGINATFDGLVLTVGENTSMQAALEYVGGRDMVTATVAAVVWKDSNTALSNSDMQDFDNPNLLLYVSNKSLAPGNVKNVVVGDSINGYKAQQIVLKDTESGNGNFFCPIPFTANRITYEREFLQYTEPDTCRGWETIVLPFAVQSIMHERNGALSPFAGSGEERPFWLRELTTRGFIDAAQIEANKPYIISMPNYGGYDMEYQLGGWVTFSAYACNVPKTILQTAVDSTNTIRFIPAVCSVAQGDSVYALNVGEEYMIDHKKFAEGSVFVAGLDEVRPFRCYTQHVAAPAPSYHAPRYIPLAGWADGDVTGINEVIVNGYATAPMYNLNGQRVMNPKKGLYIVNGKKEIVK